MKRSLSRISAEELKRNVRFMIESMTEAYTSDIGDIHKHIGYDLVEGIEGIKINFKHKTPLGLVILKGLDETYDS